MEIGRKMKERKKRRKEDRKKEERREGGSKGRRKGKGKKGRREKRGNAYVRWDGKPYLLILVAFYEKQVQLAFDNGESILLPLNKAFEES